MKQAIQTFEPNADGRDFVIGDLHGSYACLERLLEGLNFDKTKDRLFSVGDLCDRGPESLRCLELLIEPWFHATLSNHEQMLHEAFHGGYMGQFWLQNGGLWGLAALNDWHAKRVPEPDSVRLFDLLPIIGELPFLITVKLKSGERVHIIHAELPPPTLDITDEDLASEERVRELATRQSSDGDFFVWGRYLYANYYRADLSDYDKIVRAVKYHHPKGVHSPKLGRIVSGHTILQRPLTIGKQTNIDTCAYGSTYAEAKNWEALTCIELDTWQFYQATPTEFRTVDPVVVNIDTTEGT